MIRVLGMVIILVAAVGALADQASSRRASLRLAIVVENDAQREMVLGAIDGFASQRGLTLTDNSAAATETLSRPTIMRFYEDGSRAVVMVTDRVHRARIMIGAHNADRGTNADGFDDALLRHLRLSLEVEIIVNPRE